MLRAVLLLVVCLPLAAQPTLSLEQVERIRALAASELERSGAPGFALAVGLKNQLVFEEGFGLADVEQNVPAHAHTRFRTASIAKPMTATAVLQLAEQGRVDLDAPISRYVLEFPHSSVTVRDVLGHLGGIRHYRGDEFASVRRYGSLNEALAVFLGDDLLFEPREKFSYTTYGYNLLGAVVERASGEEFVSYLNRRVFEPAGMTRTIPDDLYAVVPFRTRFYRRAGEEKTLENSQPADTSVKIPGGGLLSTAADLVRFAGAVSAGRLLKPATVREAFTAQKLRSGEDGPVGLGWFVEERRPGVKMVGHGGGQQGTTSRLALLPETGTIVAVMTNMEGYPQLPDFATKLLDLLEP